MLGIKTRSDSKVRDHLSRLARHNFFADFDRYGKMGVDALASATPIDSSLTANSWTYRIIRDKRKPGIVWDNTNRVNGVPVAILIQYGHATGTGGYVNGRDFINPAMRPVFDFIAAEIWRKVKQ